MMPSHLLERNTWAGVCLMQGDVHALLSPLCWDSQLLYISCGHSHPNNLQLIALSHLLCFFCCCGGFLASLRCAGCSVKHWLLLKLPIWIYMSFSIYIFQNFESFIFKYIILFYFHHSKTEVVCLFYSVLYTLLGECFYPNTGRDIPTWRLEYVQTSLHLFYPILEQKIPIAEKILSSKM